MPSKLKKIKKAIVTHISLCPKGANGMQTMFKEDGMFGMPLLAKDLEEEGLIYGIVYSPNLPDSQGDFATPEVVKDMMHSFAKEGKGIDIKHDFQELGKDAAYVAETFLVQEGDKRFADLKDYEGNPVDATGSWAVAIKIDDEDLRQKYRDGEWKGLSMGGKYQAEEVEEDEVSLLRKAYDVLSKVFGASQKLEKETPKEQEEIQVDKKELSELLDEKLNPLAGRVEALEKAQKPAEEPKTEESKEVSVDLTDKEAVAKRLKELRMKKLQETVDVNDLESLEKHLKTFEDDDSENDEKPASVQILTKAEMDAEQATIERLAKMANVK